MTATAHALVGGVIASSTAQNPALGLTLAFVSHPLMDAIPHWDFGIGWKKKSRLKFFLEASFDFSLGLTVSYFLFGQNLELWYFWIVIFASESWDLVETPYWFLNWRFPPFSTLYNFSKKLHSEIKPFWGIVTQVVTVVLVILLFQYIHLTGYQF